MTVSSLAKKIVGVNNIVVENVDLETTARGEQLVIRARPWKSRQKRCSVCGKKCSGFDLGKTTQPRKKSDVHHRLDTVTYITPMGIAVRELSAFLRENEMDITLVLYDPPGL